METSCVLDNAELLIKKVEKELENIKENSVLKSDKEEPISLKEEPEKTINEQTINEQTINEQTINEQPEIDNKILVPFLRSITKQIEDGTISETTKRLVGELYMTLHFKNELKNNTLSENDMSKFLVLGWYIYTSILNKGGEEEENEGDEEDEIDDDVLDKYIETYVNSID